MKLLFDQNLSPRLAMYFMEAYEHSLHVQSVGLDNASDLSIWEYAKRNDFTIITKDNDFTNLISY